MALQFNYARWFYRVERDLYGLITLRVRIQRELIECNLAGWTSAIYKQQTYIENNPARLPQRNNLLIQNVMFQAFG